MWNASVCSQRRVHKLTVTLVFVCVHKLRCASHMIITTVMHARLRRVAGVHKYDDGKHHSHFCPLTKVAQYFLGYKRTLLWACSVAPANVSPSSSIAFSKVLDERSRVSYARWKSKICGSQSACSKQNLFHVIWSCEFFNLSAYRIIRFAWNRAKKYISLFKTTLSTWLTAISKQSCCFHRRQC